MERHGRAHGAPVLPRAPARSPVWAHSQTVGPLGDPGAPDFVSALCPLIKFLWGQPRQYIPASLYVKV